MLRIITLNLNGIRSAWRKSFLPWLSQQNADFVCLQELKAQETDLLPEMFSPSYFKTHFHYAQKKGYSGVGLWTRLTPDARIEGIGNAEFDAEGRFLRLDFGKLSVISLYVPSGSSSPERQEAKFRFLKLLAPVLHELFMSGREVIICGDWNIAPTTLDLKNWKSNQKNSGFLPEERAWIEALWRSGWKDAYRILHPTETEGCYTWWSNRGAAWTKNVGWRLDYQLATPGLAQTAQAATIFKESRFSDHAPLSIDYAYTL